MAHYSQDYEKIYKNYQINFKLGMMIPVTVRCDLESFATLESLPAFRFSIFFVLYNIIILFGRFFK